MNQCLMSGACISLELVIGKSSRTVSGSIRLRAAGRQWWMRHVQGLESTCVALRDSSQPTMMALQVDGSRTYTSACHGSDPKLH
jgi:hypothetical protein